MILWFQDQWEKLLKVGFLVEGRESNPWRRGELVTMISKPIGEIAEEDLQALVDNRVPESKTVEYKRILPGNTASAKIELLADVSSFANASGGDIVVGVSEDRETGTPETLEGLSIENPDQEVLRLEDIIRSGIEPKIPSLTVRPIRQSNGRVCLIIRVGRSWITPHRVVLGGHDKFYSRSSAGKYPMDVAELRVAFNLSEMATERIRNFKLDRISNIVADETPVPLNDSAKIVLHLLPLISFSPGQVYDVREISSHPMKLPPLGLSGGANSRYNIDGFLTYFEYQGDKCQSYTQLFRNGVVEGVDAHTLRVRTGRPTIPSVSFEQRLIKSLTDYLSALKILNVEPPVFMFLTLVGVKGYLMGMDTWRYEIDEFYPIDRDILQLPEVVIENYDGSVAKLLKPCFDSVWNACGFRESLYYDDKGEWSPK